MKIKSHPTQGGSDKQYKRHLSVTATQKYGKSKASRKQGKKLRVKQQKEHSYETKPCTSTNQPRSRVKTFLLRRHHTKSQTLRILHTRNPFPNPVKSEWCHRLDYSELSRHKPDISYKHVTFHGFFETFQKRGYCECWYGTHGTRSTPTGRRPEAGSCMALTKTGGCISMPGTSCVHNPSKHLGKSNRIDKRTTVTPSPHGRWWMCCSARPARKNSRHFLHEMYSKRSVSPSIGGNYSHIAPQSGRPTNPTLLRLSGSACPTIFGIANRTET